MDQSTEEQWECFNFLKMNPKWTQICISCLEKRRILQYINESTRLTNLFGGRKLMTKVITAHKNTSSSLWKLYSLATCHQVQKMVKQVNVVEFLIVVSPYIFVTKKETMKEEESEPESGSDETKVDETKGVPEEKAEGDHEKGAERACENKE
ncbi:hypothetical protein DAPPUDRAFT_323937 [Daphnia pulex]|uniref:Uncharacterized protein n=1 Tax=Daphnia pulex TaxID=6669 RepID=E9H091_DAPPU|nr:hypothetical protein DAPPUDRAFT_323937 [Daphnia pulex]|eukprot:EFX74759.1 hypothetical protein DAPPUDRAFT_323937 [Daphnia pulex]